MFSCLTLTQASAEEEVLPDSEKKGDSHGQVRLPAVAYSDVVVKPSMWPSCLTFTQASAEQEVFQDREKEGDSDGQVRLPAVACSFYETNPCRLRVSTALKGMD